MTHLDANQLIDAVDGVLADECQPHLRSCGQCQRELAQLAGVLAEAKQVSVPEPSPLFWQHFSERVRTAIDEEGAPGHHWPSWLRWQVLLPLGAVAMIVLGLMMSVPKSDRADSPMARESAATPELAEPDDSWVLLADLVGALDVDTASAVGVLELGVAERAVLELTADERQELTRLLKAELTRAKS